MFASNFFPQKYKIIVIDIRIIARGSFNNEAINGCHKNGEHSSALIKLQGSKYLLTKASKISKVCKEKLDQKCPVIIIGELISEISFQIVQSVRKKVKYEKNLNVLAIITFFTKFIWT